MLTVPALISVPSPSFTDSGRVKEISFSHGTRLCKALYKFNLPPLETWPANEALLSTLSRIIDFISSDASSGDMAFISAAAPDTNGAAIDVPFINWYSEPENVVEEADTETLSI